MKLIDIADIRVGFPFKSKDFNESGEGIRLVRGKNVTKRELRWGSDTRWWSQIDSSLDSYLLKVGDIVLGMDGSLVGKNLARIREEDLPLYLVQRVACIRAKDPDIQEFLWQSIASERFSAYIDLIKTGTSIPHISGKQIGEFELPEFHVDSMKKIGFILESIEGKININKKINRNLSEQAQALFVNRFVDIPPEVKQKPLYDFAEYINGTSFKKDEYKTEGTPIIKIAELKNGITGSTQYFAGEKDKKYDVENGDTLFSWSGNPDTSIDIFIWTHGHGILNQHTFKVKANDDYRWFVFLMLKYFKSEFAAIASNKQTTGLGHVTDADLKRLTFVYAREEIESFENEVAPIMNLVYKNMFENGKLESLRDSLLPKLMSGGLDVSDLRI